jgi:hypothetical protein
MVWRFWMGSEGLIWVDAGDGRNDFSEALNDTISALSPRGEAPALSTYWIDHALSNLRQPDSHDDIQVSSGNMHHPHWEQGSRRIALQRV